MGERVLVTGGTGYVAGWCIAALLGRGYTVRATVRSLEKAEAVRAAVRNAGAPTDSLSFAVADLLADAGWDEAASGCDHVLHVASPLGGGTEDPATLIGAAVEGTLRVLRAAVKAGVKRVVMTSSGAASAAPLQGPDSVNDESRWTDENDPDLTPYRRSKLLAERAAWDFMREHPETGFVTLLPAAIFGPVLSRGAVSSAGIILRLLQGKMPGLPRIGFCITDVRDLADLHVRAMTAPEAAGERFTAAGEFLWMEDIARILRGRLGARAAKVPTRALSGWLVRVLARVNPAMRQIAVTLGRRHVFVSAKAARLLGYAPRPAADTIADCGESLLALKR